MSLGKNTLLLTFASVLAAGLGYLFNPIMIARPLGPEGIAVLGIFLSLSYTLSFPQRPVTLHLIKSISAYHSKGEDGKVASVILEALKQSFLIGIPCVFILILASPVITDFLKLSSPAYVIAAILFAYLGLFLVILKAGLQSMLRFTRYSLILCLEPLARVLAGAVMLGFGFSVLFALYSYIGSYVIAILFAYVFLKNVLDHSEKIKLGLHHPTRLPILATWSYSCFIALALSIDTILVKHYFSNIDAGYYIAATTLAKMMFIITTPIALVSYSTMCQHTNESKKMRDTFLKSLGLTFLSCVLMILGLALLSSFLIRLTYGTAFEVAIPLLGYAGLALLPLTLIIQSSQYFFAQGKTRFIWGLVIGGLCQIAFIMNFHESLKQVLWVYLMGGALQLVLAFIFNHLGPPQERAKPEDNYPSDPLLV